MLRLILTLLVHIMETQRDVTRKNYFQNFTQWCPLGLAKISPNPRPPS